MNALVDIEVEIDDRYVEPKVKILTKERDRQVEDIINAIENVAETGYSLIPAVGEEGITFLSQRDIIRIYTEGRKVMLQSEDGTYSLKKSLSGIEEELNPSRFIRISQSEIINIYKVKRFDINIAGTIGVEFDNGVKSWPKMHTQKMRKETRSIRSCRDDLRQSHKKKKGSTYARI